MKIAVDFSEFEQYLARHFPKTQKMVLRAVRSGLRSTGFWIAQEVKAHIRAAPWDQSHPLTQTYDRKKKRWIPKRDPEQKPLARFEKLVRYRVDDANMRVAIDAGGKRGNQPPDSRLLDMLRMLQQGVTTDVTPSMRRKRGAMRTKRRHTVGVDFFPLKKATTQIIIPPRPIFDPVFAKIRRSVPIQFQRRVDRSLVRYLVAEGLL